ncbi:MAG: hypothetical protein IJU29_04335 [Oscillospiraceae bacterium]|nr:hypothetical protein [Oscillospiraceae bacterium]
MAAGSLFRRKTAFDNVADGYDGTELYAPERTEEACTPETTADAAAPAALRQGIAPFTVIGGLFAAFILVVAIIAQAGLFPRSSENLELQAEIKELREEQTRLRIAHEQAFDIPALEAYARDTLGMREPLPDQTAYIDTSPPDRAVVIARETGDSFTDRLGDFLSGLAAYLPFRDE